MVTLFPKLVLNGRVVISSKNNRSTRKNDYTVLYKGCGILKYGVVEKFLLYPADSEESIRVAIIQELQAQPCSELQNRNFPPEIESIKQVLCEDFFSIGIGDRVAILAENIVSKCFDISTDDLCIVTPMVSASEVLK